MRRRWLSKPVHPRRRFEQEYDIRWRHPCHTFIPITCKQWLNKVGFSSAAAPMDKSPLGLGKTASARSP